MPRDEISIRKLCPGIKEDDQFHLATLFADLMGRLEGYDSCKGVSRQHTGGACVSAQGRDVRRNDLLQSRKGGPPVGSHRVTPRQRPRYLDTEYRMPLAHQLREPELVGTGVYEIQGKLSPAFLQLNHRGLSLALW